MNRVLIAFGANLGERRRTLKAARRALPAAVGGAEASASALYETAPEGGADQPAYLNACVALRSPLDPRELLEILLATEARFGRVRTEVAGPRTLDLDLLLVGEEVRAEDGLELPHPRMLRRPFVLVPASECAPRWRHPLSGRTLSEHCAEILAGDPAPPRRIAAPEDWA